MSDLQVLFADQTGVAIRAVGWAVLHSLWQGALIAGATALLLGSLRSSSAQLRYAAACLGLAAMATAWTATAWRTAAHHVTPAQASAALSGTASPAAAPATLEGAVPAPLLGPDGPGDTSPAIRILDTSDRAEGSLAEEDMPWLQRMDAWTSIVAPLWLAGVVALSLRLAAAWLVVERIRKRAVEPVATRIVEQVAALARRLHIRRAVRVAQSAAVTVPAVAGWLTPVILLPATALTGLTPVQLDAVIAHELAHIRRHDFAVNLLQSAVDILLFYHPACWWLSQRLRTEREHCCDDVAVSVCGDRLAYVSALADLESLRSGDASLALAVTDGPLLQRVRRLLSPAAPGPSTANWRAAAGPLVLVLTVIGGATLPGAAAAPGQTPRTEVPTTSRRLPAGYGIVRGRVIDAQSGRPVAGAGIEISGTLDATFVKSDEEGRFESTAVKAGTYHATANAKGYVLAYYGQSDGAFGGAPIEVRSGRVSAGIDIRIGAAGIVGGRIVGDRGEGLQGVEIVLQPVGGASPGHASAFAQTTEGGRYRVRAAPGDYYVRAYAEESVRPARHPSSAYVSTFYPDARVAGEAQPIRLEPGLEIFDIDFTLATAPRLRLAGIVVDPSGDPFDGTRVLVRSMTASPTGREHSVAVDAKGRFDARDLTPGEYMIAVMDRRRTARWVGTMHTISLDADVEDLELRASAGARIAGRVVPDALTNRRPDLSDLRVSLQKHLQGGGLTMVGAGYEDVAADGTFSLEAPGGPITIHVEGAPDGWSVKAMSLDRVDVLGQLVDLGSGGTRQLEIVLGDKTSSLSGLVVDRKGTPLNGYSVVLFAEDQARWTPSSPFVRESRSSQTGRFEVKDVPTGDYYAVAVPPLPFRAFTDNDILVQLQSSATRLQIGEGERKTISIRASPTPPGLAK